MENVSSRSTLTKIIELLCYAALLGLSVASSFYQIPIHVNLAVFSMGIIYLGSNRSLDELIFEIEKVVKKEGGSSKIETMSKSDALQFPIFAGAMLGGLYVLIKYFGKEIVNQLLLGYIAIGSTTGFKTLLLAMTFEKLKSLDHHKLVDINTKYFSLTVTPLDLISFGISCISCAFYVLSKSWIYNNVLAIVFCIHALQFIFLGNFQIGMILLGLLFFYDIFFVFGTDIMVTVAKSIDAPIKLMFPKDITAEEWQYSILGLGDIVIPGVFMSLCLRFDYLKNLKLKEALEYCEKEKDAFKKIPDFLRRKAAECSKHYFIAVQVGYLIAIIATVVVMLIFEHGQPALLYLVPGCILSVVLTSLAKGEFSHLMEFNEEEYLRKKEEGKSD